MECGHHGNDVKVTDEDGYLSRNMTIRANVNDDSQFANKIAKERIWINPVTSKIMKQPLESDTDAQVHEERVISVRKQANIGISSSTKETVPGEMRTPWKLLVDVMSNRLQDEVQHDPGHVDT